MDTELKKKKKKNDSAHMNCRPSNATQDLSPDVFIKDKYGKYKKICFT
jgi:hypothetical protein